MSQALSWLDGSNLSNTSKILDAGCGAGRIACEVARRDYDVIGMDYSYGMIEKAISICKLDDKHYLKLFQAGYHKWGPVTRRYSHFRMAYRFGAYEGRTCL